MEKGTLDTLVLGVRQDLPTDEAMALAMGHLLTALKIGDDSKETIPLVSLHVDIANMLLKVAVANQGV